jgi:hypothetical protein
VTVLEPWRAQVLEVAQDWLRTPWAHRQCLKGAGVDCGLYLLGVYVEAGHAEPSAIEDYPRDWMCHRSEERFLAYVERYMDPVDTPQPADVAVWRYGRCFSHGAIVYDWPRILHAYLPERAVVWGDGTSGALARRVVKGGGNVPREVRFYSRAARLST